MTGTTTQTEADSPVRAALGEPDVLGLVIAWCPEEPERVGEVFLFPSEQAEARYVVGRGGSQFDDPGIRVYPARQRPGRLEVMPALGVKQISRVQLGITVVPNGLQIRSLGRASMLHREQVTTEAEVHPGDAIQLGTQLLLLCTRRPRVFGNAQPEASFPYGQADALGIVGESPAAWQLRKSVEVIAARAGHVLVLGASGTGKELVAAAIHARSARSAKPLVARNAATLPEGLLDAELFGNARNFPNPGMAERPGLIGQADGSTLFLDEFAELPLALQAHLLRVLDGGEYHRLGEALPRRSDFRLIAATNRRESSLKHDIAARLTFRIDVPDLNARREDIPLLVRHQMRSLAGTDPDVARAFFHGGAAEEPALPCALIRALLSHVYTTNVRELYNLLWGALVKHLDGSLPLEAARLFEFPGRATLEDSSEPELGNRSALSSWPPPTPSDDRAASSLTPEQLQACLDRNNGAVAAAARELGLSSRYALHRLIRKYRLQIRKQRGP